MSKIPSHKPKELLKKFIKLGFVEDRQKGSHIILFNSETKRRIVIPIHVKDLPRGTLSSIIKQSGLTRNEFLKLK